jgi:GntR family transcriptional repressor for pyruvate dehydrogenase complex
MGSKGQALRFAPIRSVRLYERVIDALSAYVAAGSVGPDNRFPPERDLEAALRVSRPVLKEAFRALEMHGYVESRQGGGRYLIGYALPTSTDLRRKRLAATRENLLALWDAREWVEIRAAELAAMNATKSDLAAIAGTLNGIRKMAPDDYRATDYSLEFHIAVARASGNPFFERMVRDLIGASREIGFKGLVDAKRWDELQDDHKPIYDAMIAKNASAARAAMIKHFAELRAALAEEARA